MLKFAKDVRKIAPGSPAGIYNMLGMCYRELGRYRESNQHLEQATRKAIWEEIGNQMREAHTSVNLRNTFKSLGPMQLLDCTLVIYEDANDRSQIAKVCNNLGL